MCRILNILYIFLYIFVSAMSPQIRGLMQCIVLRIILSIYFSSLTDTRITHVRIRDIAL